MTGTFGSLNIAKTGLQYQQIAIDIADNNISNVNTTGYVRESAQGAEMGGPSTATMWSTYPGYGEGVESEGVQRLSDVLLGARQRTEHASLSSLTAQQTSMTRLETAIGEPSDDGVSAAMSTLAAGLQDLVNSPDSSAARGAVINDAGTLAAAFNSQAQAVSDEESEASAGAVTDVAQINGYTQDIATLNKSIGLANASGNDSSALQDQRDQDALQLAQLCGATTTVDPTDGSYSVTLGASTLVSGTTSATLSIDPSALDAQGNVVPGQLAFDVDGTSVSNTALNVGGDLGGLATLLNVSLPTYKQGLDQVVTQLAQTMNDIQTGVDPSTGAPTAAGAYDLNGNPSTVPLFTFSSSDPSGTITVNPDMTPADLAASAVAPTTPGTGNLDATNADAMSTAIASVSGSYQSLVANLGVQIGTLNTQVTNQQAVSTEVDNEWQQSSGVSLDEETINLMSAQRAYEASAKVLSVMDDVLDTLINNTVAS